MRCPNGFLGTFLNDMTILLLVTLLDKTVSVEIRTLAYKVGGDRSIVRVFCALSYAFRRNCQSESRQIEEAKVRGTVRGDTDKGSEDD